MNGKFLIARYVSDLERQEPRNIGVIVWTKGAVAARFIEPESVDFIEDRENCARWITYWEELCSKKRLQVFNLPAATVGSPRFLTTLQKTQRGNYTLSDGGQVLTEVSSANIKETAKFLYSRMVAPIRAEAEARQPNLSDKCYNALAQAGITERESFRRRYPVVLRLDDVEKEIHFDFGSGGPFSLFNKVNLAEENSVTQAAGKCDTAVRFGKIDRQKCFSLYDSGDAPDVTDATVKFLSQYSIPVDVSDPETPPLLRKLAA